MMKLTRDGESPERVCMLAMYLFPVTGKAAPVVKHE